MLFRQIGILLMIMGFLGGQLLASVIQKASLQVVGHIDAAASTAESIRALNCIIWGNGVALLGLVIYFYGVLTSRSGRGTSVVVGTPR